MGERSERQVGAAGGVGCPGWAAAGTAGAGPADRRLAVEVLVALGERDAAERRAGELLQSVEPGTAFVAAGGRLARRPDHGPQRNPFA